MWNIGQERAMTAAVDGGDSDGRVVAVIEPEDEVTWPVERTDVFISRTPTETWPAPGLPHGTPLPARCPELAPGLPHGTPLPARCPELAPVALEPRVRRRRHRR
jgi:hypothetical protein